MFSRVVDFIFPWLCFGCGDPTTSAGFCASCWLSLRIINDPLCPLCGRPVFHDLEGRACLHCQESVPHFATHRSLWAYGPLSRRILFGLKYGYKSYLATHLAYWMVPAALKRSFQWIVPVPLHRRRLKKRGFNQAALLAKPLSRLLGIPCAPQGLVRLFDGPSQGFYGSRERHENVLESFISYKNWKDATILLVDDVFTTGATLNACSLALLEAGARCVHAQTVAQVLIS